MARRRYKAEQVYRAIGLNVRALRNARGWTLEDAEERGPTTWQQLQKIESGRNVTVKTLVNIANLYGLTLSELLEGI